MSDLLDTDYTADWLHGAARAAPLRPLLAAGQLAISLVTYGEIYEGIYFGRDPRASQKGFSDFLRSVDVFPLNRRIMQRFARIRGDLRRSGQLIGDPDLLIAATALHYHRSLITRNVRHFQRIAGLQLHQP